MPFPSGTYINQILDAATRSELQQFYSLLQGYLSAEHKDDGSHGHVTADSVAVAGPITATDGTFTGTVTADSDGTPIVLGPDAIFGPGVQMTNGALSAWRISAYRDSGNPVLLIRDLLQVSDTGVIDVIRTSAGALSTYVIRPHANYIALSVGADALNQRLAELNALIVRANTAYYERGRTAPMGEWTAPAFAAGDFTATGGGTAWTVIAGNVVTYRYAIVGKTMTVIFEIDSTNVTGAPTEMNIKIPGGFTAAQRARNLIHAIDAGASAVGIARVNAADTIIRLQSTIAGAGWTATAGSNTFVRGQLTLEVQ